MSFSNNALPPPKNGLHYVGLGVCRISTIHQDEKSLDDQFALYGDWVKQEYPGEVRLEKIASQGSGERVDRVELREIEDKIELGGVDFIIAEDLGRIMRRVEAILLCERCEDSDTRLIAINDQVDTFREGWRQNAFFASMRHESSNTDTSNRIRRSVRNRFSNGQLPMRLIPGYEADTNSALDSEVRKVPSAEPVYDEWFTRLERGETFARIADWLNEIRFPLGPYRNKTQWTGTLVGQVTRNPLLKGVRVHNVRKMKRINKTGRRKSVRAPEHERLSRDVPHLAFIDPERYDRVLSIVNRRNAKYRNGIQNAVNTSPGRARRDTRWPAQHVLCGVCGRKYVLGGHGVKDRMMCDGARQYRCWNSMTVDRPALAQGVAEQARLAITNLPEFDHEWTQRLQAELQQDRERLGEELQCLRRQQTKKTQQIRNLTLEIANGNASSSLLALLNEFEVELAGINDAIFSLEQRPATSAVIPSADHVRRIALESFESLALNSQEFGEWMRSVVHDFFILPFRLVDGGHIQPRVVFQFDFGRAADVELPESLIATRCEVDLTTAPLRVGHRKRVVELRAAGKLFDEIAAQLRITDTAAQQAMALHRLMESLSLTDPWQRVTSAEDTGDYFKRLTNPRFSFCPVPGFVPPHWEMSP
ncbi:recombinase family protein [Rubinisphaera margarita]|uniref:recombinase family protein n=1 Tax=Rubinisphaera margarita TaxID=2909586 RepID=UPI001EE8C1F5|nr:recombinase family protein [Rubinisphaera margarita]MCG6156321.1 recombinase family protein [Rubinisphaera margarita]